MRLTFLAVFILVVFASCARPTMPVASPGDVERATERWPDVTSAKLEEGRTLYVARCSGCHQPVAPTSIPTHEWAGHITEMRERANLTDDEAALIERYVVTMSEASSPDHNAR